MLPPSSQTQAIDDPSEWKHRATVAEQELRLLRAVLDLLPDYFYVHNWDLRFQHVNTCGAALWGMTPEQLVGKTYQEVDTNTAQADRIVDICQSLMRRGGSQRVDNFAFQTPEGDHRVLSQFNVAFKHPLTGEDMLLGVARDMTAEARLADEIASRQALEHELRLARAIQQALEPRAVPHTGALSIGARNFPSAFASGDFFDWWTVPSARGAESPDLILCLADVTGHGVGAALTASACRAYARTLIRGDKPLHLALADLNDRMCQDVTAGRFVTFACARVDITRHHVAFASAGHGPTLLCRADAPLIVLDSSGLPLGVSDDAQYEPEREWTLAQGEALVMLSDGLIEARSPQGAMLTAAPLATAVSSALQSGASAPIIADHLINMAVQHAARQSPEDDMTVLSVCAP